MSKSLFITANEDMSGKSAIALGIMEMLLRKIDKVGFFRPIINEEASPNKVDRDIHLISTYFNLGIPYEEMYAYTTKEVSQLLTDGKEDALIEGVIEKYNNLKNKCDFVLCEGIDTSAFISSYELDINAEICKNLNSQILLVANGHNKSVKQVLDSTELALESLNDKNCPVFATIVNRVKAEDCAEIKEHLKSRLKQKNQLLYTIPDDDFLSNPTVGEVAQFINAKVLYGENQLKKHVHHFTIAAMQLRNFVDYIRQGALIVTPGDRADVIVGCLASLSSRNLEKISGILLTGGLLPEKSICQLIEGFPDLVPILTVAENTFETATIINRIHAKISPEDKQKITCAFSLFENNVDVEQLQEKIVTQKSTIMTPKMFEYGLIQKAKKHKQHIVLPEGEEERILIATDILLRRGVVDITLLGDESIIHEKSVRLGLKLEGVRVINPLTSGLLEDYVKTYYEMRKHKNITTQNAYDNMSDATFFGTMMVYKKQADAMVSGAIHSTASTIRPAFEIIKTVPGCSVVSSVFFMCMEDHVLVYGDCAVNANPNASQLAEIAISSSLTAKAFGIEPVVAMLSYSTGSSGHGEDVDKVRDAIPIAKEKAKSVLPGLKIDGPIQYDAAVEPTIAKIKLPQSEVAGRATVFIFPDLNTGNNTYKAVQRTAGIVAIGPVLQGLNSPVNDLSRGCTIPDIINTVAITAIQAQSLKGLV